MTGDYLPIFHAEKLSDRAKWWLMLILGSRHRIMRHLSIEYNGTLWNHVRLR
jgi:hypothetical protein